VGKKRVFHGKGVGYDIGAPTYQAPESLGYLFRADNRGGEERGFPRVNMCALTGKIQVYREKESE
jgi:hypothetical protein